VDDVCVVFDREVSNCNQMLSYIGQVSYALFIND